MADHSDNDPNRRDFIYVATAAFGAVGAAAVVWPFVDQMNPDASVLALASIEVDLSTIEEGEIITVMWRKKPVFIRRLTQAEIEREATVDVNELIDPLARNENVADAAPATEENRALKPEWVIMGANCTHLGCVPLNNAGDYKGWFCPCHGSHYDALGRIRKGPAPENLPVPEYAFIDDNTVRIG